MDAANAGCRKIFVGIAIIATITAVALLTILILMNWV